MNRPMVWVAVPFVTGLAIGSLGFPGTAWIALLAGCSGLLLVGFGGPSDRQGRLGMVLTFAACGVLYWVARHVEPDGDELLRAAVREPGASFELSGRAERPDILIPEVGYGQFTLRVDRFRKAGADDWTEADAGTIVRWTFPDEPVFSNDRVVVAGTLEHALSPINPGTPSYEDYLRRRSVHTAIRLRGGDGIEIVDRGPVWSPSYWASRVRYAQAVHLSRIVPEGALPFVFTVWLGERRLIDNSTYRAYVESGTAHILAVSGVHTGIVYVSVNFLLFLVLRNYRYRRIRLLMVLFAVFAFALVAGARVSSMRAATMIALYVLAQLFDRDPDAPTALSLAALTFTLHHPVIIFDPGFMLSFLAIASLLIFRKPVAEWLSFLPGPVRHGLAVAVSVQILSLPVAAAIFHVVPVLGVLANLVVVPLLTIALWLAFVASLLAMVAEPMALIVGHALFPVVAIIELVSQFVSDLSVSHVGTGKPTPVALAVYALGAYALYQALVNVEWRFRWTLLSAAAFCVCASIWSFRSPVDEVVFLDVGQGDSTIVRTATRGVMVVDAGDRIGTVDYGERSVAAFLRAHGISRINALVGTHADKDHLGGMAYLLRHFRVDSLYLTNADSGDELETTLEELCAELGVPVRRVAQGDRIPLDGASVGVLHPPGSWNALIPDNDRSLVLRVELGNVAFLLTGDVESAAEARLLIENVRADVLKVSHHGSRTSSSSAFITTVDPKLAVVSTGRAGRKRILSEAVLAAYHQRGISVLRTDLAGGIRVRVEGGPVVETARGLRGYPVPASIESLE